MRVDKIMKLLGGMFNGSDNCFYPVINLCNVWKHGEIIIKTLFLLMFQGIV